jgi:hypothetical protein
MKLRALKEQMPNYSYLLNSDSEDERIYYTYFLLFSAMALHGDRSRNYRIYRPLNVIA